MARRQKETPPLSIQESILATLLFSDKAGTLAGYLEVVHFDDPYRNIASAALGYLQKYKRPPGNTHLDDLFATELSDQNSPTRRILLGLVQMAEGLNVDYVITRVTAFIRDQKIKAALIAANSRYEAGGDEAERAADIEEIFSAMLKERGTLKYDPIFADRERALGFLDERDDSGYSLGIPQLDNLGLRLKPAELLLFIAPKGVGKTWFCIHTGRQLIEQGAKVAHASLEFSKDLTMQRYMQSFFSATSVNAPARQRIWASKLKLNDAGWLIGRDKVEREPRHAFSDPDIRALLREEQKWWGWRLGNLVVDQFPTGRLTVRQLENWLDYLEREEKFIPNALIVDYPRLMKIDPDNLRIDLGQTMVNLRGLAVERNLALVCPHQGNRSTMGARKVRSREAGEDISVVQTADNTITMSRTDAEERFGLARLLVDYARNTRGATEILITQSYDTGQFVLESALMTSEFGAALAADEGQVQVTEGVG